MDCSTAFCKDGQQGEQDNQDGGLQQHLTLNCTVDQMSILHKYVLRSNRVTIKDELELAVLDHLIAGGVLTLADSDDIQAERTRRDKVVRLLDLLERRGSIAFSALVDGLKETQKHLAIMLENWVQKAMKIDDEVMLKFVADDSLMSKERTVLPLNIVTIHMEQRVGNAMHSLDLPLSLDVIMGDGDRYRLLCSRLQELHASICSCKEGSILLMLSFKTPTDLTKFWLAYLDGTLQRRLAPVLVTDKLKQEFPGAKFTLNLNIDIDQYIEAIRQIHDQHEDQVHSVDEVVPTTGKYAELDMSIELKYLHGDSDEDLKNAQRILDNKLLWSREPRCINALSELLERRGLLLLGDHNSSCLQARSLNLNWLSKVDSDFSWSLDATEFASMLLDASVIQAAKGNPLNISCFVESVRIARFTIEEEPMLNQLRELTERMTERPEEDIHVSRFLADLTTEAFTDVTSDTSGFVDDFELIESDFGDQTRTGKPIYDIASSENRGVLVIINNKTFSPETGLPRRVRVDVDMLRLNGVFTGLGFKTQVMQDLRASEMEEFLWRAAMKAAEDNVSCFACAILTHGEDELLYGVDGPINTKALIRKVASIRGLAGKPKIFFIQAPRGNTLDHGVVVGDKRDTPALPSMADILICNSSTEGYHSWRNNVTGSWFVNAIESVFTEYGKTEDILSLMTRVGHAVSMQKANLRDSASANRKQMPVLESSLTKTLYLTDHST